MAISRAHQPSSHARLHKRGSSASSITSPSALSPLSDTQAFVFNRSETPKVTYEEPWNEAKRPMPSTSTSHQLKIKPYLRKLSSKDSNAVALDLSKSAADNEGLAGLGISDFSSNNTPSDAYSRSVSDVTFTSVNPRGRHTRTTSNTSQFSNASSLQRPTAPYMPPIRQTRPYTPPISNSTPASILDRDNELEADDIMSDEELRLKQNTFDPARRSGSLSSTPGIAPALRIHTTGSTTRLGGSYSPSSVSLTSPIAQSRSRGDTLNSLDKATSPSSRTSFDKAFGFIRGGRDSPVDPASRAASIQAARQAFNEKEQAKELKYSRDAIKQAERDSKRQVRKDERARRKSDARESRDFQRSRSISDSNEKASRPSIGGRPSISGRPSIGGRQYSDHRQAHTRALPSYVHAVDEEKYPSMHPAPVPPTKTKAAQGRWQQFIAWFRTRILRLGLNKK